MCNMVKERVPKLYYYKCYTEKNGNNEKLPKNAVGKPLFTALGQMLLTKEKVCCFICSRFYSPEILNRDKSTFIEFLYIIITTIIND